MPFYRVSQGRAVPADDPSTLPSGYLVYAADAEEAAQILFDYDIGAPADIRNGPLTIQGKRVQQCLYRVPLPQQD